MIDRDDDEFIRLALRALRSIQATAESASETGHEPGEVVGANYDVLRHDVMRALSATPLRYSSTAAPSR